MGVPIALVAAALLSLVALYYRAKARHYHAKVNALIGWFYDEHGILVPPKFGYEWRGAPPGVRTWDEIR